MNQLPVYIFQSILNPCNSSFRNNDHLNTPWHLLYLAPFSRSIVTSVWVIGKQLLMLIFDKKSMNLNPNYCHSHSSDKEIYSLQLFRVHVPSDCMKCSQHTKHIYIIKPVILKLVEGTEPHKFYAGIHRTLR